MKVMWAVLEKHDLFFWPKSQLLRVINKLNFVVGTQMEDVHGIR